MTKKEEVVPEEERIRELIIIIDKEGDKESSSIQAITRFGVNVIPYLVD